jgi:DNA-binding NtrC family response regulator
MAHVLPALADLCTIVQGNLESVVVNSVPVYSKESRADVIFWFVQSSPPEVLRQLAGLVSCRWGAPVIMFVSESSEDLAIAALRAGVRAYFKPPVDLLSVANTLKEVLGPSPKPAIGDRPFIGASPWTEQLRRQLQRIAASDSNVLITGETGTGKELIAQTLHDASRRKDKPMIAVNCAALPDALLESELFGHERGAFTGAFTTRDGRLKAADHGTVFLDEIGEMSPYGQAKILRVIETRRLQRVGGKAEIPIDVRIVAATNQDLDRQIAANQFRKDLYFRLNVARVHLRPLRERREDIPGLLEHYIDYFNRHCGKAVAGLTGEALEELVRYDWPGNVRELKNLVEAVMLDCPVSRIGIEDLPWHASSLNSSGVKSERELLLSALQDTQWNKSKAAEKLNWSRMTLYRKLVKHGLTGETPGD